MYRTLRQVDQVKLVIVDLDDTLWRGVVAEDGHASPMVTEGWPIGFVEALAYLKRRGVLLAIASKNDEARIRALWPSLYGSRLELDDFACVRINWHPKTENVEQILRETNLLPRSVVFIDDNPVERAAMASAFPDLRILGASPYVLRRILLWSAETQVAHVTAESARRTEMVQAQVAREATRSRMTREDFLATLDVGIRLHEVGGIADPRFSRALELINKSNQFNTTGRRWKQSECQQACADGTSFWAFEVSDRFTQYGIVGVAITSGSHIQQFVMSCRVVGLGIEVAVIAALAERFAGDVTAALMETDANFLCRDLYVRCGFVAEGGGWRASRPSIVGRPPHIRTVERQPG
jgi:FkbH-like protein